MNVLVTGNMGYLGSVLSVKLLKKGFDVKGFDANFFQSKRFNNGNEINNSCEQIIKDIRKINFEDLNGVECIIHLCGLSNDPLGDLNQSLTYDINFHSTIRLAKMAKEFGVKRFLFASTQSIYGISNSNEELDEDNSKKNPITPYAISKWNAEIELKKLSCKNFTVVCFRPSTVFGPSSNLRCDIVFNNLLACAFTTKKIEIKSDGSPWRPVVHVDDVCDAFIAGLVAPAELVNNRSYNVGIKNGNYTVKEIAETVLKVLPKSKLVFTNEHVLDVRTYKVSFNRIFEELSEWYKPKWSLYDGGKQMINFFKKNKFQEKDFKGLDTNRILKLNYLINKKKINKELYWKDRL